MALRRAGIAKRQPGNTTQEPYLTNADAYEHGIEQNLNQLYINDLTESAAQNNFFMCMIALRGAA